MTIGSQTIKSYSFTAADGTLPAALGITELDSNNSASVVSNKMQVLGAYPSSNYLLLAAKAALAAAPVQVQADLGPAVLDGQQGVIFLFSGTLGSSENAYRIIWDGGSVNIDKAVAGTWTNLSNAFYSVNYYSGSSTRFAFDVSGSNATLTLTNSADSYSVPQTFNDTSSAFTGTPDVIWYNHDTAAAVSTIDNVIVTGTASAINASGAATEGAADTSSGNVQSVLKGLRTPTIYEPNNDSVIADATGVRAICRDAIGGNEIFDVSTATISGGVCTISNTSLPSVGTTVDLELRWTASSQSRFLSAQLAVLNLNL